MNQNDKSPVAGEISFQQAVLKAVEPQLALLNQFLHEIIDRKNDYAAADKLEKWDRRVTQYVSSIAAINAQSVVAASQAHALSAAALLHGAKKAPAIEVSEQTAADFIQKQREDLLQKTSGR